MASSYYDKSGKNVSDGNIAYANDLNQINEAVDTGFAAVESDMTTAIADSEVWAEKAEEWAENPEDVQVETDKYSALHHAAKAEASATSAATSETNAAASEAAALISENNASSSAGTASSAAIAAGNSEAAALAAASQAGTLASLAGDYATSAGESAASAAASATDSSQFAQSAEDDATTAAASAAAAATSETNAATSETNAETAEVSAEASAATAIQYAAIAQSVACQDLSAVSKVLGLGDIVDVFVYDTRTDSDEGAWTKKCRRTSWYNELASSTRGSRRDFPTVAIIVATATAIYIYDASTMDMWMIFSGGSGSVMLQATAGNPRTGVVAKEGRIYTSVTTYGCPYVDFIEDSGLGFWNSGNKRTILAGISERNNTANAYVDDNSVTLVNNITNDVAITTLAAAETNPLTGLKYPTVGAATDGGVSVIDGPAGVGTIVDVVSGGACLYVDFSDDERMIIGPSASIYNIGDIPSTDYASLAAWRTYYLDNSTSIPVLQDLCRGRAASFVDAIGSQYGLTLVDEDTTTPANSMVAYMDTEQPPMWQQGDIKGAFLASTTEETIGDDITTEFVANGVIDDEYGWDIVGSGLTIGSGIASFVASVAYVGQNTLTSGVEYRTQYSMNWTSGSGYLSFYSGAFLGNEENSTGIHINSAVTAGATGSAIFSAKTDTITADIDDVWVWEAGAEEVTNGDFATGDATGWTEGNNPLVTVSSGQVTIAYVDTSNPYIYQVIDTVVGGVYEYSVEFVSGNGPRIRIGTSVNGEYVDFVTTTAGTYTFTFKATTTTTYVRIGCAIAAAGSSVLDNVSVRKVTDLIEDSNMAVGTPWLTAGTASVADGEGSLDGPTGSVAAFIYQSGVVEEGKTYIGQLEVLTNDGTVDIWWFDSTNNYQVIDQLTGGATGILSGVFTPSSQNAAGYFGVRVDSSTVATVTNMKLYEAELVNGTWQPVGNLLVNPSFEGWLDDTEWDDTYSTGTARPYTEAGELLLPREDSSNIAIADQSFTTVVGDMYELTLDNNIAADLTIKLRETQTATDILTVYSTSAESLVISFVATTATTWLRLFSTSDGDTPSVNNISVKRIQNLVENWEFSSDRAWEDTSTGTGTATISGGVLTLVRGADSDNIGQVRQEVSGVSGKRRMVIGYNDATSTGDLRIYANGILLLTLAAGDSDFATFESDGSDRIVMNSPDNSSTVVVPSIELYELSEPDRSYNDNQLQVVGTLEKTAVNGGELVAYSGFSTDNYIKQPYNSDLYFSTGDFLIACDIETGDSVGTEMLLEMRSSSSVGYTLYIAGGYLVLKLGATLIDPSFELSANTRYHIVVNRDSTDVANTVNIWVNGVLIYSGVNADDVDPSGEIEMLIGQSNLADIPFAGSICLLRIGATAPSADQIAKMYNDEKHLFDSGANCTLQGSSDEVIDLSYNEDADEYLVATDVLTTVSGFRTFEKSIAGTEDMLTVSYDEHATRSGTTFNILDDDATITFSGSGPVNTILIEWVSGEDIDIQFNGGNYSASSGSPFAISVSSALQDFTIECEAEDAASFTITVTDSVQVLQPETYTAVDSKGDYAAIGTEDCAIGQSDEIYLKEKV